MITPSILAILCCPETRQSLRVADAGLVEKLNGRIASGALTNRGGKPITARIEEGLIRHDGKFLYPVRNSIPVLLIDEGIPLD
jgi:uncharacterized protein YbaR (Trm112 family)